MRREPVYFAKAGVGIIESNLVYLVDKVYNLSGRLVKLPPPVDELFEVVNSTTYRSILEVVAGNMGELVNFDSDNEIQQLLGKFNSLGLDGAIRYGVWGSDTEEGKAQARLRRD